jgi:hypothetical protein
MVEIPAGEFAMGLDGMQALEDERPQHRVWPQPFFIDRHKFYYARIKAEAHTAFQRGRREGRPIPYTLS